MKKPKFPLIINDAEVRNLNELKQNFNLKKIKEHFISGKLQNWLSVRRYNEEYEAVLNLNSRDEDFGKKLCEIFNIPYKEGDFSSVVDENETRERVQRQDRLRQYTQDTNVLDNYRYTAFNQEELMNIVNLWSDEIYLINNTFEIPLDIWNKSYIGIGEKVIAKINSDEKINFDNRGISFKNISFDKEYTALLERIDNEEKKEDEKTTYKSTYAAGQHNAEYYQQLIEQNKSSFKPHPKKSKKANHSPSRKEIRQTADYYRGQGNYQEAIKWYRKAFAMGDNDAQRMMELCRKESENTKPKDSFISRFFQ